MKRARAQALAPLVKRANVALERALADIGPQGLREACLHYPRAGGKRLRPVIAMLSCAAAGGTVSRASPLGVAIETIHNFSLIHDDFMDNDHTRRGMPAAHVAFGVPTAILAGDTLFAKAFEVLARLKVDAETLAHVTREVATASREICEGQHLDMAFEQRRDLPTVDEYLTMVDLKTAALFRAAAKGGALVGGADAKASSAFGRYGRSLGIAFQIQDDLLDLTPTADTGKPFGSDIRAGKKTLVLLEGLARAGPRERAALVRVAGRRDFSDKEVADVVDILEACGAIGATRERARREFARARTSLRAVPASSARSALMKIVDDTEVRTR